ncbi:ankyrin repeat-containing protein [Grosmannia clavigera kw1407]|uniref:Ankyrin repeat-containing protein n=1 Tax=Grosmannia clavigera (strain kw1407 / UAMH 11150) TaxID=655863 RepID=F0XEV6_GROCL|nr:ankyrin repeat-containing protein [Grosmannia clavigera kw1407]EFX03718.1 ankyrin repeat-containing protein [Grosmannia clavigera kw1407]
MAWDRISTESAEIVASGKDFHTRIQPSAAWHEGIDAYLAQIDFFHQNDCLNVLRENHFRDHYFSATQFTSKIHGAYTAQCIHMLLQALKAETQQTLQPTAVFPDYLQGECSYPDIVIGNGHSTSSCKCSNMDEEDEPRWTDLQLAAKDGDIALQAAYLLLAPLAVVRALLEAGADVNAPVSRHKGFTALQAACIADTKSNSITYTSHPLVELLLTAGANTDAPGSRYLGASALHAAAHMGHADIVQYLLSAGTSVNLVAGPSQQTPLQTALFNDHSHDLSWEECQSVVKWLQGIDSGLDWTPLDNYTSRSNVILVTQPLRPNKSDALAFLDNQQPPPPRFARVSIKMNALDTPVIEGSLRNTIVPHRSGYAAHLPHSSKFHPSTVLQRAAAWVDALERLRAALVYFSQRPRPGQSLVDFCQLVNGESISQGDDLVLWLNLGMHHGLHLGDLPNTLTTTGSRAIRFVPYNYLARDRARGLATGVHLQHAGQGGVDDVWAVTPLGAGQGSVERLDFSAGR